LVNPKYGAESRSVSSDIVHGDENKNRNLSFTFSGSTTSRLWNGVPNYMMDTLMNVNLAFLYHLRGISPESLYRNKRWSSLIDVSSVSYTDYGRWYISSAECKTYPFYGAQFHSELNTFHWDPDDTVSH